MPRVVYAAKASVPWMKGARDTRMTSFGGRPERTLGSEKTVPQWSALRLERRTLAHARMIATSCVRLVTGHQSALDCDRLTTPDYAREVTKCIPAAQNRPNPVLSASRSCPRRLSFINYLRQDTQSTAWALYFQLRAWLGAENVFFDHGTLRAGMQWLDEIESHGASAGTFIALIGPDWMSTLIRHMKQGGDDYVAKEIDLATTSPIGHRDPRPCRRGRAAEFWPTSSVHPRPSELRNACAPGG